MTPTTKRRAVRIQPKDTTIWQHQSSIFQRSRLSTSLSLFLVFVYFGDVVLADSSAPRTTEFKIFPPPPRPGAVSIIQGETAMRDIPPPPPKDPPEQKPIHLAAGSKIIPPPPPPPPRALSESVKNLEKSYWSKDGILMPPPSPPQEHPPLQGDGTDTRSIVVGMKAEGTTKMTEDSSKIDAFDCTIEVNVPQVECVGVDTRRDNWNHDANDAKPITEEVKYNKQSFNEREDTVPEGQILTEKHITSEQRPGTTSRGERSSFPSLSMSSQQDPELKQSLLPRSFPDSQPSERQRQHWQEPVEPRQFIRPIGPIPPHQRLPNDAAIVAGQWDQRTTYQEPNQQWRANRPSTRRAESSPVASVWKSIWGKVERGLDTLVDLEDSVTGRAQQLLSTASSAKGRPVPSTVESSRGSSQAQRFPKMTTAFTEQPLAPYGNKFEVAKKKQEEKNQAAMATGRIIRANGGASSPDGQQPVPPSLQYPASAVQSPLNYAPPPGTAGEESIPSLTQTRQYIPNPYLQSSNLKTPLKQVAAVQDPHARASRIPWDSSTSSSVPSARPAARGLIPGPRPEYEIDKVGFGEKLIRFLSSIPNPAKFLRFSRKSYDYACADAWDVDDEDEKGGFFRLFRKKQADGSALSQSSTRPTAKASDALAPPLKSIMERCDNGKSASLLSSSDETRCRTLGRYQALFDGLCILCVLVGIQQTDGFNLIKLPWSLEEFTAKTLPLAGAYLRESLSTWAPIFAGYAYLALYIRRAILSSSVVNLANSIGSAVQEESQYAQLYLRLAAAVGIDPNLPSNLKDAAASQVHSLVSTTRLNAVVMLLLGALTLMTVTIIRPIFTALGRSVSDLLFLEELRSWPIAWQSLGYSVGAVFQSLFKTLESLTTHGLNTFLDNPVQFSFQLSIFASAVLIALIPNIERTRMIDRKEDDEVVPPSSGDTAQQFAKLGSSSATRLTMLSENGSIESALERWRHSRYVSLEDNSKGALALAFRSFGYKFLVALIATLPVVVSYLVGMSSRKGMAHIGLQWDSLMDVSIVLVGVYMVASNAIENAVLSTKSRGSVHSFVSTLASTIDEIKENNRRQADIQFMASVSPTAGLVVRDLWAAHTTKRAWAVRGATFQCKNGEILAVLGDDGAGKSRLLTTIAEALLCPPRRSLTSAKVRGFVGIGGVESSKWDKSILRRRLGVLLSDVRTVADAANLYSGCSMEEILEPVDGVRVSDGERKKLGASERSSILLALKITGLYSTLIPKLPSKLSTVLTANEEELRPSSLGPRSQVLSPGEWSKLILSKVLAQTIHDNDNAAASTDKVENCLVGSVLLLDDPTSLSSEVDEAKILKDLRQTGAAIVLATNKWATGRFADHIVVVRDGAIVESGSHNDLISRGPQQSLYAAKWHAMTMQ